MCQSFTIPLDELPDTRYVGILEANSETAQLKKWNNNTSDNKTTCLKLATIVCTHTKRGHEEPDNKQYRVKRCTVCTKDRSRRELKAFTFRSLRSALTKRFLRLVAFLASLRFCRMALRRSACWPLSFCNSSFKTSWPVMRTPKWSPFWTHNSEAPKQGLPGTCFVRNQQTHLFKTRLRSV